MLNSFITLFDSSAASIDVHFQAGPSNVKVKVTCSVGDSVG
jgi:hypothetical protein